MIYLDINCEGGSRERHALTLADVQSLLRWSPTLARCHRAAGG